MGINEDFLRVLVRYCIEKMATLCFKANRKRGVFLTGLHLLFIICHLYLLML